MGKNKLLFAATALAGLAAIASPARAELKIDLSGYAKFYAMAIDNDEINTAAPSDSLRDFEFVRYTGLYFVAEQKLENGLTVGFKGEFKLGNESMDGGAATLTSAGRDFNQLDEAALFISGSWGKLFMGSRDSAPYLLSVQAPSADSNIDGQRIYVQSWNADIWDDGLRNASYLPLGGFVRLSYDNVDFGKAERVLYATPKWNGLQLGVSYAPMNRVASPYDAYLGATLDDRPGRFENIWDAGAKWETQFLTDFKFAAAIGYAHADTEVDAAAGANGSDEMVTWNTAANLGWKEFSIGAAYKHSNTGVSGPNTDQTIKVAGIAWDQKPWHLGASYYDLTFDANAFSIGLADDLEVKRTTVGGSYLLGPGISLRGTFSWLDVDNGTNSAVDPQQTQLAIGTDVNF